MAFTTPHTQKLELRAALDAEGWDVEPVEPALDAWWLNELWRLRSRWSPVGATLFVSFCTEPDGGGLAPPGKVGSVGIGPAPARAWGGSDVTHFPLSPGWPKQLPQILAAVARFREAGP